MKIHNQRYGVKRKKLLHRETVKRVFFTAIRTLFFISLIIIASIFVNHLVHYIVQSSYLSLKDVQFEGCQKLSPQELMRLTGIPMETNIFTLNLKEIARQLKFNRWVKEVKITRIFPHALKIKVDERIPVAIVSHEKLFFLDKEGVLFKEVENKDHLDMPVITGLSFSEQNAHIIKKVLSVMDTADKTGVLPSDVISEIHVDSNNGLTFYTLQDAIPIRIGIGDYREKLNLLSQIQEDLHKRKVKAKAIELISSGVAHVRLSSTS